MSYARVYAAKASAQRRKCPTCRRGGALRVTTFELGRVQTRVCRYCGFEDHRSYSGARYVVNQGRSNV